jgi:hypothetical protein
MTVGNGIPSQDGQPTSNNIVTDLPAEAGVIRPASDDYARALSAAGVDFVYRTHNGIHDWSNFRPELESAIDWGLFEPVDENPTSWVNDTVATHGRLFGFAYKFDAPPDQIVRFRRSGGELFVSGAGSPVTITTDGGCAFHVATPGSIDLPATACTKLAVTASPTRVRTGHATTIRFTVTPAPAGTILRSGSHSAEADAAGVAYLPVCAKTARGVKVTVRAPGFATARAPVRARGRTRGC